MSGNDYVINLGQFIEPWSNEGYQILSNYEFEYYTNISMFS